MLTTLHAPRSARSMVMLALVVGHAAAAGSEQPAAAGSEQPAAVESQLPVALVPLRTIGGSGTGPVEFRRPGGLATTPMAGVLVADVGNSRVQHIDLDKRLLWEAGGLGTQEGSFGRPTAVATAAGLSYLILDSLTRRVLEFHARGEYIGLMLDLARPDLVDRIGEVDPRGLAVDREGNTIISDHEGDRLLVFSPVGEFLYEVGGFGGGAQSFEDPDGVAVSARRIYVADSMNGRVQVLDSLGGFVDTWELPEGGRPVAVAVDRHGNVFVADAGRNRVVGFGADGSIACELGATGRGLGSFRRPSGLCVVGEHLVVADADNDRLQILEIEYGAR